MSATFIAMRSKLFCIKIEYILPSPGQASQQKSIKACRTKTLMLINGNRISHPPSNQNTTKSNSSSKNSQYIPLLVIISHKTVILEERKETQSITNSSGFQLRKMILGVQKTRIATTIIRCTVTEERKHNQLRLCLKWLASRS